jgi:hypothetical protein
MADELTERWYVNSADLLGEHADRPVVDEDLLANRGWSRS